MKKQNSLTRCILLVFFAVIFSIGCSEESMYSPRRMPTNFDNAGQVQQWATQVGQRMQVRHLRRGERGVVNCRLLPAGVSQTAVRIPGHPGTLVLARYYYTPPGEGQICVANSFACENVALFASNADCTVKINFVLPGFTSQGPFEGPDERVVSWQVIQGRTLLATFSPIVVQYNNRSVEWVRLAYACDPQTRTINRPE